MTQPQRIRVAVLYGGRSGEHEISLQSAASVIANLDPERYEVIPIGVDKQGRWRVNSLELIRDAKVLPIFENAAEVVMKPHASGETALTTLGTDAVAIGVDVVFPVMHGPLCEDGSVQGLLELADVPYVGAGVLGSALGMDKEVAKRLVQAAGLPVVPFLAIRRRDWDQHAASLLEAASTFGFPCFVKPCNMGSSVGVHKVHDRGELEPAIRDAFRHDTKILVEKAVNAREIELAALEDINGGPPRISVVGEIRPTHEFYSYESKYLDEHGAELVIPAPLNDADATRARELASRVFDILECEGMARVDLFLDKDGAGFLFNEINTIPGFTKISMYPKMWEATGLPYRELLSCLIDLAMARHRRRSALSHER